MTCPHCHTEPTRGFCCVSALYDLPTAPEWSGWTVFNDLLYRVICFEKWQQARRN